MLRGVVFVLLAGVVLTGEIRGRLKKLYDQYDPLLVARCEVNCNGSIKNTACLRGCLYTTHSKPGVCPQKKSALSPFALVCLDTCKNDSQCPEITKCCGHDCGVTCQPPERLDEERDIPEVPNAINVSDFRPKRRTIIVRWSESPGSALYLLEERHSPANRRTSGNRATPWIARTRTSNHPKAVLTVKPGRQYQYRVAALSGKGDTKGFSKETEPFAVAAGPKRPNPTNITIDAVRSNPNGTVRAEFHWKEPASDLPIKRYKVFWSERLQGVTALDSVLVNRGIVPKGQTWYLVPNLKPNCSYFLQVQAISQFGKVVLRGEKANYYLNTTDYTNGTERATMATWKSDGGRVRVRKLFWGDGGLRARLQWVTGGPKGGIIAPKFAVTWRAAPCGGRKGGKATAMTTETHYDLYDLQFNCRYRVNVREISKDNIKSEPYTSMTFTTPTCRKFQETSKRKAKCDD